MSGNPKQSPWYSTPRDKRNRRGVEITLSDEAHVKLERLAEKHHMSKSAVVEALILEARGR